jgi:signal transduction histidine kinase
VTSSEATVPSGGIVVLPDSIALAAHEASGATAVLLRTADGALHSSRPWTVVGAVADAAASCPETCASFLHVSLHVSDGSAEALFGFADGDAPAPERLAALVRLASLAAAGREAEAREELTTVADIVSGISHDIGTPLNVISGYAESILMTTPEDAPGRKQVGAIVEQTRRIAGMVRQMLDIVRPSPEHAGGTQALDRFAADVVQISGHMLRRREVRCRLEEGASAPLSGDLPRLHQALFGVLRGAARLVGPRGQLTIRATCEPGVGPALRLDAVAGDRSPVDLGPLATAPPSSDGSRNDVLLARRVLAEHGGAIEPHRASDGAASGYVLVRLGPPEPRQS